MESCPQPHVRSHRLLLPCSAAWGGSLATAVLGRDRHLQPQFRVWPLSAGWFSLPLVAVTWELVRCEPASCCLLLGWGQKGRAVIPTAPSVPQMSVIPSSPAYACLPGLAATGRTEEESGMCLLRSAGYSDAKWQGFPRPIVRLELQC